ncbi:hypothetical protein [Solibacillus isronensis]|uniref:hypothetical protein n=1 Tax=Solibacillus isronensis TaxID=412383 RepID=UPI0009A67718|nr:hypothetical protein [Solibacillus isronensis]
MVKLYKDSILISTFDDILANSNSFDLSAAIAANGDGNYTATVTALGNGITSIDGAESLISPLKVKISNQAPTVTLSFNEHISDLGNALNGYYGQTVMIYNGRFSDPNSGDVLNFTFSSSNPDIVTIKDIGNGMVQFTRILNPVNPVDVTFTITADDGKGGRVSDIFKVTIN